MRSLARQMGALLLLLIYGTLLPLSATQTRVCMLGEKTGASALVVGHDVSRDCCSSCTRESEFPALCCIDIGEFPDATPTQSTIDLPLVLLPLEPQPLTAISTIPTAVFSYSEPIRGPTSPAAHRAVLGIWRL